MRIPQKSVVIRAKRIKESGSVCMASAMQRGVGIAFIIVPKQKCCYVFICHLCINAEHFAKAQIASTSDII